MIFCARATRGLRRPSLDARSGRSISHHPQERTRRLGRIICSLVRPSLVDQHGCFPREKNKRAWKDLDKCCLFDAHNRGATRLPLKTNEKAVLVQFFPSKLGSRLPSPILRSLFLPYFKR
jgi:hypothetical protein